MSRRRGAYFLPADSAGRASLPSLRTPTRGSARRGAGGHDAPTSRRRAGRPPARVTAPAACLPIADRTDRRTVTPAQPDGKAGALAARRSPLERPRVPRRPASRSCPRPVRQPVDQGDMQ